MLQRALKKGVRAEYVLFDRLFAAYISEITLIDELSLKFIDKIFNFD